MADPVIQSSLRLFIHRYRQEQSGVCVYMIWDVSMTLSTLAQVRESPSCYVVGGCCAGRGLL